MTKIEELEQKLNELLKTITKEEMIKALEEAGFEVIDKESKKEGKWKPNLMDEYWIRDECGSISPTRWDDDKIDNWRYNNIPIFPTEKDCERYWRFMDTVKEKSYEFSHEEWIDGNVVKYYIYYNFREQTFKIDQTLITKAVGRIHFKTEEDAQYIIDNFKEELMEFFVERG